MDKISYFLEFWNFAWKWILGPVVPSDYHTKAMEEKNGESKKETSREEEAGQEESG